MYNVVFDADEDVAEQLIRKPGNKYYLECIQSDAVYTGSTKESSDGSVVFKIRMGVDNA